MSNTEWKIPAIKYHQLHGLDKSHPIPGKKTHGPELQIGNLKIFGWWKNRIEKTYHKYKSYSDCRIILQSSFFAMLVPFVCFDLPAWLYWFEGGTFAIRNFDPSDPISAVFFAPLIETFLVFFPLLEISRHICLPRWLSYPAIIIFFESLHDQRSFLQHPFMWMTAYMFIVAYEAGRTRSLLHALLFCTIVHEAYNISCYLLHPRLYQSLF